MLINSVNHLERQYCVGLTFVGPRGILLVETVTHRAEVVEGEGLGDIIDDSLHGDNLKNNEVMTPSYKFSTKLLRPLLDLGDLRNFAN